MKKLYTLTMLFGIMQIGFAQSKVSINFIVDASSYLGNLPVIDSNIKIGGNFTDAGSSIANWDALASPKFKFIKDKLFYTTIEFDTAGIGRKLNYKFIISPNDWGTCGTLTGATQECIHPDSSCREPQDDYRSIIIPKNNTTIGFIYNTCQPITYNLKLPEIKPISNFNVSPNPIVQNGILSYNLLKNDVVKISLFNHLGQEIKVLSNTYQTSGKFDFDLNMEDFNKGNYFLKLNTPSFSIYKQFIVQ